MNVPTKIRTVTIKAVQNDNGDDNNKDDKKLVF